MPDNSIVSSNGFDPWSGSTGTEEYSRDKHYTRSVNKHDHSANLQCPLPRETAARVNELVSSKNVPEWKTAQDFIRDAINHHLQYWCVEKKVLEQAAGDLTVEQHKCEVEQRTWRYEAHEQLIESAVYLLETCRRTGDADGMRIQAEQLLEMAQTLPRPFNNKLKRLVQSVILVKMPEDD